MRYLGIVVPIGIDFAYRWNRDDPMLSPQGRFQWFLNIGEAY